MASRAEATGESKRKKGASPLKSHLGGAVGRQPLVDLRVVDSGGEIRYDYGRRHYT